MDTVKRFYPVSEVAARFDVTSQTVRNWIAAGRLHSVQPTPGGRYKIPTDELARFERESGVLLGRALVSSTEASPGGPAGRDTNTKSKNPLSEPIASELRRVVDAIATSIRPDAVILFGSRARGDARAESDFDLAIVAPDGAARRRVAMRAYESLAGVAGRSVAVDIVVLTPSIITAERDLPCSISRAVAHEGVVLYGSRAALA